MSKLGAWADKFENKAVKIIAFWGTITGLVALIPSICYGIYKAYLIIVAVLGILTYIERF